MASSTSTTERGSRTGRVVAFIVIGVVAAAFAIGWGVVMFLASGGGKVANQVVAFSIGPGNAVSITFDVLKPADRVAVCGLRATDAKHMEVGSREVIVPAGKSSLRMRERLDTTAVATSADVTYCHLK